MYKIEKNIPIPITNCRNKYPFNEMNIKDSFLVEDLLKAKSIRSIINNLHSKNKKQGRSSPKFITRKVSDGLRVWRIE